ncbi:MAG: hypothetical protein JXR39_13660 [Marinilabiliaceae bacterium]|nr:hypothetical protein [Marinilabiliaceae bacterium]
MLYLLNYHSKIYINVKKYGYFKRYSLIIYYLRKHPYAKIDEIRNYLHNQLSDSDPESASTSEKNVSTRSQRSQITGNNLIYTEAVDRYLKTRIKDYNYQQHFSGVIYLFVRGVRKHSTNGIFITKPGQGAIGNILREVTETCEVK